MGRMLCRVAQAKGRAQLAGLQGWQGTLAALSSSIDSQPGPGRWREGNVTSGHSSSCEPALSSPLTLPNASSGARSQSWPVS